LVQSIEAGIGTDFPKQPSIPMQTSTKDEPNMGQVNYHELLTDESADIHKPINTDSDRESATETLSNEKNNVTYNIVSQQLITKINRDSEQGTDSKTNIEGEQLTNDKIKAKEKGRNFETRFSIETNSKKKSVTKNTIETPKTIISSNDKPCIFPFKYEGVSYTSCTDKDSAAGTPWFATGVDTDGYVGADEWSECEERSETEQEQTTQSSSWFSWLG
jgi:hypothetical protein